MRVGICYYLARPLGLRPLPDIARYAAERGFLSVLTRRATRVSALSAATAGLANLFVRMNSQLNTRSKRFRFPLPSFIKRRATQHQHAAVPAAAAAKQQAAAPGLLSAATKPLLPPLPVPVPTANNSSCCSIRVRCANNSGAAHTASAPTSVAQLGAPTAAAAESSSCCLTSTALQTPAPLGRGSGVGVGFGFDLGLGLMNPLPVHLTRQSAGPDSGIVSDMQSGAPASVNFTCTGEPQSAAVAIGGAGVDAGEAFPQPQPQSAEEPQQQQCANCEVRMQMQYLRRAVELLDVLAERVRLERRTETVRAEWKFAARVVDRLCLAAFAFLTIFVSIIVLFSAPGARL